LLALHARTGTETVLLAVRNSKDHYNPPYAFGTSVRVSEFFNLAVRETMPDFAVRFEAFCLSGVQGIVVFFYYYNVVC